MSELAKTLGKIQAKTRREIILETYSILENANNILSRRGLINCEIADGIDVLRRLPKISEAMGLAENPNVHFGISPTLAGYDLGRKYNSWWSKSGLWFAEYKNHWIWLIVSYIAGIISMLLVNWLSK